MKPKKILLGANKPFLLTKHDCVWIVVSGEVEVYFTELNEQGKIDTPRNFLFSAGKGEMLFSLKDHTTKTDLCLLVVSSDAKLIEVRKEHLPKLNQNQLAHKVDKWILKLGKCLKVSKIPRIYNALEDEGDFTLPKNKLAFPVKGVKWVKLKEGSLDIYGEKKQEQISAKEKITKEIIPVSAHLWVKAIDGKASFEVTATIDIIQDEISLMLSLQYLQRYFLAKIENLVRRERKATDEGIRKKLRNNESMIEDSLNALKSIIDDDDARVFSTIDTKNKLLATCQIIGRETGFTFVDPKFTDEKIRNRTNLLASIAQVSNVRIRKVVLRGDWWKQENGHLLAFREGYENPVALIQKNSNSYVLKDVKTKSVEEVTTELAFKLEPIAYMFFYAFDGPMTSVKKIGTFAIKGLKKDVGLILIAAFFGSLLGLFTPILSGILFDDVIPQADRGFLLEVVGIMVMIGIISALLQLIKGVLRLRVETKSNINIQAALMDHLLRLPVTFYRDYSVGDLTLRALGINSIRQILSNTLLTSVLSGAFSIVNLVLLFYYAPKLAWIGLALSLFAVIVVLTIGFLKLRYDRQIAHAQGDIQGFLFEFVTGISKVRVSGSEKRIFALWANKFGFLKNLSFKSVNYGNLNSVFNGSYPILTNIFFFGAIYYIVQRAVPGEKSLISVGIFMAFITAFNQFLNDCLRMSSAVISSLNIVPLYERLKPILDAIPESTTGSADPGELQGEIEMNAITFRYHKDQGPVLKNVSFKINAGEMVAFVGPSGSGKSTIMRLLLGFEEPESGSIYYDGQTFESLNKELVRQQMGVVLQDGALMAGSIYENIVGNLDLTLEDALNAAQMAGLSDDIKQMPMGMHTVISEGAGTFSGGQRQRLMIARAIVHKPRILYMDEATSALDNRTQNIVKESLDKLQATRIVIAHRLSTVINADTIYVMEDGEIVESGNYRELMKIDGLFAKLAKRQIV